MATLSAYQTEFVGVLTSRGVPFLVMGGRAIQAHGVERDTYDLDLFVCRYRNSPDLLYPIIAERLDRPISRLSADALRRPEVLVCVPSPERKEIDLLTSVGALDFDVAASRSISVECDALKLPVLGLNELIYSKAFSIGRSNDPESRERDILDLQCLMRICIATNRKLP